MADEVKKKRHPTDTAMIVIGIVVAALMGWGFGYAMGRADAAPAEEEPVADPRVTVEVLYNKRPEVAIVTVDGTPYIAINYMVGGAGVTPMVVPEAGPDG